MIELRIRIFGGLLMLFAAAPEAIPQTAQSGPPTRQVALRKMGKSGNNGSSPATVAISGAMPGLCFELGVGWQSILPESSGVPATPGTHGSKGLEVSRSTTAAHAPSMVARSSSVQRETECGGNALNKTALGTGENKFTIPNPPQRMRSARLTKSGTVTSLRANSPYSTNRRAGLEPVGMMPSGMSPAAPTHFASEIESDAHPDQAGVRAFHAYTSSIKLRRLIRNASDFRTRIQLQQLQSNPQLQKARAAARGSLQGERASRTSSRISDTHDWPRGNPYTLVSGAHR